MLRRYCTVCVAHATKARKKGSVVSKCTWYVLRIYEDKALITKNAPNSAVKRIVMPGATPAALPPPLLPLLVLPSEDLSLPE